MGHPGKTHRKCFVGASSVIVDGVSTFDIKLHEDAPLICCKIVLLVLMFFFSSPKGFDVFQQCNRISLRRLL